MSSHIPIKLVDFYEQKINVKLKESFNSLHVHCTCRNGEMKCRFYWSTQTEKQNSSYEKKIKEILRPKKCITLWHFACCFVALSQRNTLSGRRIPSFSLLLPTDGLYSQNSDNIDDLASLKIRINFWQSFDERKSLRITSKRHKDCDYANFYQHLALWSL